MNDDARATCMVEGDTVTIGNRWLRRTFRTAEGCATTSFAIRPYGTGTWLPAFGWIGSYPLEAEVTIDGERLRVGVWHHQHFGHDGDWSGAGHEISESAKGVRLELRLDGPPRKHGEEVLTEASPVVVSGKIPISHVHVG